MELEPSAFLQHSLGLALSKDFRALRMVTTTSTAALWDISTPGACATYLSLVLEKFVGTLDSQEQLEWGYGDEAAAWLSESIREYCQDDNSSRQVRAENQISALIGFSL